MAPVAPDNFENPPQSDGKALGASTRQITTTKSNLLFRNSKAKSTSTEWRFNQNAMYLLRLKKDRTKKMRMSTQARFKTPEARVAEDKFRYKEWE